MAAARQRWKADQPGVDVRRLVFVDETGTSTKMVRTSGRCRRSRRLLGKAPWGHWKTITFTAGLRCDGLVAPFVLDGPMNGEAFLVYVETVLAPSLSEGDIVVIDNLSAQKVEGVRAGIEARRAILLYLPPYSPDLNPIEMAFAKLKTLLRRAAARTRDSLWSGMQSPMSLPPSRQTNAPITSHTQDMLRLKRGQVKSTPHGRADSPWRVKAAGRPILRRDHGWSPSIRQAEVGQFPRR